MTGLAHFLDRTAATSIGLIMMVAGLGSGVTLIMLPWASRSGYSERPRVIGGLFAQIDGTSS